MALDFRILEGKGYDGKTDMALDFRILEGKGYDGKTDMALDFRILEGKRYDATEVALGIFGFWKVRGTAA